ncbi:hypothetical protein [Algibacter luteus]|uniref:Uncharacterized protein n=1 Tax=Algibacter luteus TaxID=1178825 RepID=A0A1M6DAY6_9FLAO|nr:hypothetical protein [Algibacter luteus]SHI70208.1 hypothetical protein SAMN05216261_1445 [Algibacter luteus]
MKIAFCLHGLSAGLNFKEGGLPVTFSKESDLFKKHILDLNDVDCFFHTWESDSIDDLVAIYKPKKHKVEPIKTFKKPNLIERLKHKYRKSVKGVNELQRINNVYSRWYSFYESTKLVEQYEKETGIKYDFIFNTRFDMSLFKDILFQDLDKSKFYCGDWYNYYDKNGNMLDETKLFNNKEKHSKEVNGFPENINGLSDFWFCSGRDTMVKFSQIYFELKGLVKIAGKSNHRIALAKLRSMNMEKDIAKILEYSKDYYLSRWIED